MCRRMQGTSKSMDPYSSPSNRTLRSLLAGSPPHVSLKKALRALIGSLRAAGRRPGSTRHALAGRGGLERVLQAEVEAPPAQIEAIKSDLRTICERPADSLDLSVSVADRMLQLVPIVLSETAECSIEIRNRPPQMDTRLARVLLGTDGPTMTAGTAAGAVHRLQGLDIGGYALDVHVSLPEGHCLPAVRRSARGDRGRWGRDAPWLEYLDETGRASLTPLRLAQRMARLVGGIGERVLDACCGCGGNAVAFAAAGRTVLAWEVDRSRADLARRNVRARGVADRVSVRVGSIEAHLARSLRSTDLLFVDPPWLPDGRHRADDFAAMFRRLPVLAGRVADHGQVLLKLPRTFRVDSLPGGASAWELRYELGARATGDAGVVRLITALRRPFPSVAVNR